MFFAVVIGWGVTGFCDIKVIREYYITKKKQEHIIADLNVL
jgi:hypothetical protein